MKKGKKILIGIAIFLGVIILTAAALFVFRVPIAKSIIEKGGSAVAGAKVEVTGLQNKPFTLSFSWDRLQFTDSSDTWKNAFETGKVSFDLAVKPLTDKKIIIETMTVESMQFDTKRETDGYIPPKKKEKKKASKLQKAVEKMIRDNLEKEKEQIPVFNPDVLATEIDVDSLMTVLNLVTPGKVDSLKSIVEERYNYWETRLDENDYEKDINTLRKESKKISVDGLKDLTKLQSNLETITTLYETSQSLYKDLKQDKENFDKDFKLVKGLRKDVPAWIQHDYQSALNLAELPDFQVQYIANMLFGDKISSLIMNIVDSMKKPRELAAPKEEPEPRKEKFPELPSLWIKTIKLTATTPDGIQLSGVVTDVSNDQTRSKKPMRFELKGQKEDVGSINLTGIFDYRTERQELVVLQVKDVPIRNVELAKFDLLPRKLKSGYGEFTTTVKLTDEQMKADFDFQARDIVFDYATQPKLDKRLVRVSRAITEAMKTVDVQAEIVQKEGDYSYAVESNLDELIAREMKAALSRELDRAIEELKKRVRKEIEPYEEQLNREIAKFENELNKRLGGITEDLNIEMGVITDKEDELKKKIDDMTQGLGGKVLDNLLKW